VIVLAIRCALGRWEEVELHLRAALLGGASGLKPEEVKEVLMQAAIYAGVPAANTAFTHAMKVMRECSVDLDAADVMPAVHPGVGRVAHTTSAPALHYTVRAPRRAPTQTIVLAHALGCDLSMWDALANALAQDHRVIAYDQRGHGGSVSPAGRYTMSSWRTMRKDCSPKRILARSYGLACPWAAWSGRSLPCAIRGGSRRS
jgi:3-oxoadipate enol-lactonase